MGKTNKQTKDRFPSLKNLIIFNIQIFIYIANKDPHKEKRWSKNSLETGYYEALFS